MVPACSHRVSRVPWYSGYRRADPPFMYGAFTFSGRPSQGRSIRLVSHLRGPNPGMLRIPVWALSGSLAATSEITFVFFSSGYLDVSVHRVPPIALCPVLPGLYPMAAGSSPAGFPHSEIRGSQLICSSPRLFAAYHVFLRLLVPRHPPCALLCLTCLRPFPSSVAVSRFFWDFHPWDSHPFS